MANAREKRAREKQETRKANIRADVEHPFRVIKRQFGLAKVRFRGLAKNTAHVITLFALSNLWMARRRLLAMIGALRPQFGTRGKNRPEKAERPLDLHLLTSNRSVANDCCSVSSASLLDQTFLGAM